ncbi:MAG: DUF1080 domain-containing protein [Planctomycetaceae bacterium]|jgi:hypothetical protein|nr:DUF1080 domain-containing protein [Planctomycetaceae bacterium]
MRMTSCVLLGLALFFCMESNLWAGNHVSVLRTKRIFSRPILPRAFVEQTQTVATPRVALFNGKNLDGWTTVGGGKNIKAWDVVDGTLHRKSGGGDIVTEKEYGNFILEFEWKISPKGNSGLKYKFAKHGNDWIGCEFQVLDDAQNGDGKTPSHRTGSLYDIIASPAENNVRPVGEYNQSKIIVNGARIQHWLNGKLLVDVVVGSSQWNAEFNASKFKEHQDFGKIAEGKILLQDHGNEVWFKNITIRELKTVSAKKHGLRLFR